MGPWNLVPLYVDLSLGMDKSIRKMWQYIPHVTCDHGGAAVKYAAHYGMPREKVNT